MLSIIARTSRLFLENFKENTGCYFRKSSEKDMLQAALMALDIFHQKASNPVM